MRLDKYLKVSRIIKRRTVANDACDAEHVFVNGKRAKVESVLEEGDELTFYISQEQFDEYIKVKKTVYQKYKNAYRDVKSLIKENIFHSFIM